MSIVAFKKKSVIKYGSNVSGKPPGGYWLPQGPFGLPGSLNSVMLKENVKHFGYEGFSINGGHRNVGGVGQNMKFSKNGTPYRGVYAIGWGGTNGRYPISEPDLVMPPVKAEVLGTQLAYIKPSVLSTRGMLRQKYRWIYNGQYPNYWVQPNYGTSNLSDNTSQGLYVETKSAANDCVVDTNDEAKYVNHIVHCGPFGCQTTDARGYTFSIQQANAPYTKFLHIPQTASQYTLRVQRKCANPTPRQKPFPYATNGDTCNNTLYQVTKNPTNANYLG
jgi:hypothetical protein